jgi:hypothetical protein
VAEVGGGGGGGLVGVVAGVVRVWSCLGRRRWAVGQRGGHGEEVELEEGAVEPEARRHGRQRREEIAERRDRMRLVA